MARAIDADKLKKELAPYEENDFSQQIDMILKIVDMQPTLTPPNEWVNRNVRLPEWQADVLVLYDSGKIDINWVDSVGEFMYENIYGRVTHWMPLPAPPAGGS